MDNEDRKEIIRRYLAATARRDFAEMAELLTEDFTLWMVMSARDHGLPFPMVGREAFFAFVRQLEQRPNKWTLESNTPIQFFFDGDYVAARVHAVGKYPSGFVYDNEYVFIYRLEGDRIAEFREFTDTRYIASLSEKAMVHGS